MRIERQKIYLRRNKKKADSYMLVLSTSRSGMTIMYLAPGTASSYYENIDGIYFSDLDAYAAFDRVLYVKWENCRTSDYTEVYTVPYRKYSAITTAINQFFNGQIVHNDRGHFYYHDELESAEATHPSTNNITVDVSVNIESAESNSIELDTKVHIDSNDAESDGKSFEEEHIEVAVEGDEDEMKNEDNPNCKYYNLLTYDRAGNSTGTGNSPSKKYKHNKPQTNTRTLFTEDETLAICNMTLKAIMSKHNVSQSTAFVMRKNAMAFMGFSDTENKSNSKSVNKNKYTQMFESGCTVEEVINAYPDDSPGLIRHRHRYFSINKDNTVDVVKYFDRIICDQDIDTMIEAVSISTLKFCEMYNCNKTTAVTITRKIKDILCLNPLFSSFGKQAYDDNIFEAIEAVRGDGKKENIVMVQNYDTCMRLKDIYVQTYNEHADILAGIIPIPDCIEDFDKGRFLSLINNRFNRQIICNNRTLSMYQKDIIKNSDIVAIACEFMVSYSKARAIRDHHIKII